MIEPKGSVARSEESAATDAEARRSALSVSGVLLAVAAWNGYRGRVTVGAVFGALGALLLMAGLFIPAASRAFHRAWMRFAAALGHVNSRVLLTLMYYVAFTPYRLVSRLLGRDPLRRRGKPEESYWVVRKGTRQTRERFERLF